MKIRVFEVKELKKNEPEGTEEIEGIYGTEGKSHGIEEKKAVRTAVLCAILALALFKLSGIPCVSRYFFGVSCPGCGMTRAWLSAVRLDFEQAFYYHPMFLAVPFVALIVIFRRKIPAWLFWSLIILTLGAYLWVYWYRLNYSDHVVVYADFGRGLIFRLRDF